MVSILTRNSFKSGHPINYCLVLIHVHVYTVYQVIFGGQNIRGLAIFSHSWFLFSWLLLALQIKVGKVSSFVGKTFVVVQC